MQHPLRLICIKTRRNWNTGATAGREDMPGKSLFSRSAPVCKSGSCLALNFKTYMKGQNHRKTIAGLRNFALPSVTNGMDNTAENTKGNTWTAGLTKASGGANSMAMFLREGMGKGKGGFEWL